MAAGGLRKICMAFILAIALLLSSCATYPAFQDSNIDYNGRWGTWDGGMGAYGDPSVSLYEGIGGSYRWYPGGPDSFYHYRSGDDPHRYWQP